MKRKLLYAAGVISIAMMTGACSDNPDYILDGKETLADVSLEDLSIDLSTDEVEMSRAADDINVSSFFVNITDPDGDRVYSSTFGDMEPIIQLPVAKGYTVSVENHPVENAAWDSPYYAGSKSFDVEENKINSIGTVSAVFSNIRISIRYTDELKSLLGDDVVVTVRCSETGSSLNFIPGETRSGYFKALDNSTTLAAEFNGTVSGVAARLLKTLADVKAGQHRIITFDVRHGDDTVPDEYGAISVNGEGSGTRLDDGLYLNATIETIDVNGNVNVEEESDSSAKRPGDEDNGNNDDPTPPTPGAPITITANQLVFDTPMNVNADTQIDGTVKVHADKGIQNLYVKIVADPETQFGSTLEDMKVPTDFDLAHTTDANRSSLVGFGFPIDDEILGNTDVEFVITDFIPLLSIYPGTHKFVLTVFDSEGKSLEKSLIFNAQ